MKGHIISTTDPVKTPKHGTITDSQVMFAHSAAKQARINCGIAYLEMDLKIAQERARKYPCESYIKRCEEIKKEREADYLANKEAVIAAFNAKYGINAR